MDAQFNNGQSQYPGAQQNPVQNNGFTPQPVQPTQPAQTSQPAQPVQPAQQQWNQGPAQSGFGTPQSQYPQPTYMQPAPQPAMPDGKGLAIAGVVIGALGLAGAITSAWTIVLGIATLLFGIVGLVLACVAKSKWKKCYANAPGAKGNGLNIAGIALGIATIVISLFAMFISVAIVGIAIESDPELYDSIIEYNNGNTAALDKYLEKEA